MTSSDLERQSARLRREVLDILEGGLMGLLERQFGKIHLAGSVALDLMTWPDIDLFCHLEHADRTKLMVFAPPLAEQLERQGYRLFRAKFNDEHLRPDSRASKPGLYGGYEFLNNRTQVAWKLDFWGWSEAEYAVDLADKARLAERLMSADRRLILELKTVLHHHPEYRKTVYSVDIYSFALERAGSTLEEFWRWLEARRAEKPS
ncbi:MAG: hypothetical protein SFU83_12140 [Meiothermus sp.]|nr:hypothetical protein [Meiothermus sp.]